ncbi:S-arrestin-like isoform 1-T2 [Spinachia spinachia]
MSPKHVVFKKVSRDKSLSVYMAKRDFVDHGDFVDPVDGVIVIDPMLRRAKKVYVMLSCTFRYGRQDVDVMGVAFRRDLLLVTRQVYPELQDKDKLTHTKTQKKLLQKLGPDAFPFFFEFPDHLPCSVALQPGPSDVGKKCAVEFEVKAFCGHSQDEKDKQSSVRLSIRKIQFSPGDSDRVPVAETTFEFLMSDKPLRVKLSLEKEVCGATSLPVPVCLSLCPSTCLSLSFPPCLSLSLSLSACPSLPLPVCLSLCPSICLSLSPSLPVCLSLAPSPCLSVSFSLYPCLSLCLSPSPSLPVCLSVCLSLPLNCPPLCLQTFYHGEPVRVDVEINNSSSRNIKDITLSVDQVTNIVLYSNDKYVKSVAREETMDSVPPGTSLKKIYTLFPLLIHNKDRRGLALDGPLKHEDTNLASSSIVKQEVLKEVQGILVTYKVVVKMMASGAVGSSEVSLELPFRLMNPNPETGKLVHISC